MNELKALLVKPSELTSNEIAQWRSFLWDSPALASPFLSYAYAATAQHSFGDVRIAKLVRAGQTVGFFPFQYRSKLHRLFGIGQRVSGELADYFGVIAPSELSLSGRELVRLAGLTALYFTHLDEQQQRSFGLGGAQPELGLRIEFPQGGKAFWKERRLLDKKFTSDTERRERKLIEAHGPLRFVFRHTEPAEELRKLISAKRSQYVRTGVRDAMAGSITRDFLEKLSMVNDPDCWATLSTLHAGEAWVGSHFGLMCGNSLHYWFPVYNPEMRAFAPGRLLVKAIIDSADQTNVRAIDRGAGDTPAKQDFATAQHQFLRGVWIRPGPVSIVYRAGLSVRWRVRGIMSGA